MYLLYFKHFYFVTTKPSLQYGLFSFSKLTYLAIMHEILLVNNLFPAVFQCSRRFLLSSLLKQSLFIPVFTSHFK